MRRVVDIPQDLLERLEVVARREGTTVEALLERTLRQAVGGATRESSPSGPIEPVTVGGDGLREGVPADFWDRVRDFAHDDRAIR